MNTTTPIPTTTVAVSDSLSFLLAQECAKRVHAAVIGMHVSLTGSPDTIGHHAREIAEVRALIGSLPNADRYDARRQFVRAVSYYFRQLRADHGTQPRWQDYIAKVRAYHPADITAECEAKLVASGYATQPVAA